MNRARAQAAIEEAYCDGMKTLFVHLVTGLESDAGDEPLKRFRAGLQFHDEALSKATAAIETIFPE